MADTDQQSIADNNQLHLYVRADKTMAFTVSKNETVEQLKSKVGSKIGVSYRSIRLTYGTKYLVDKCRLGDYLPDQATIFMCTCLLGGNGEKKVKVRTLIV